MAHRQPLLVFVGLALLVAPVTRAETRAFFSSQESLEKEMIGLIEHSRSSIEMALFQLRSPRLVRALEQAQRRGVRVRLILDASHRAENLSAGNVRWLGGKTTRGRGIMHHKFAIFDCARVATGSYNWTPGAEYVNYENALLTDDGETVRAYTREFEDLWRRAAQGPAAPVPWRFLHSSRRGHAKTSRIKASKVVIKRRKQALK